MVGLTLFPGNPPPYNSSSWDSPKAHGWVPLGPSPEVLPAGWEEGWWGWRRLTPPHLLSLLPQIEFNKDQLEGEEELVP